MCVRGTRLNGQVSRTQQAHLRAELRCLRTGNGTARDNQQLESVTNSGGKSSVTWVALVLIDFSASSNITKAYHKHYSLRD